VKAWGLNFVLSTVQDACVKEPIKVFVVHVMLLDILKPQLVGIKRTLLGVIVRYTKHGVDNSADFRAVQVLMQLNKLPHIL
jgi:hypothetical protein